MRPYEVVIIVDAGLEDEAIQASLERATKLLTEKGANVDGVDRWGKRRFAYELDHRWEGYYALLRVTSEPPALAELDRMLQLADEVLRHKIVRLPKEAVATPRRPSAPSAPEPGDATPDAIGA